MEELLNNFLLVGSILLVVSVFLSKSSTKFGLPILVLFMLVGMAAGTDGLGIIHYEDYELTHSLSLIAICIIIFSGGLSTEWKDVKPVLKRGIVLSSLGVVITTALLAAFVYFVFNVDLMESLLLASILSSTDAAAVFAIFRDKRTQVRKNLRSLLEFESGSNDPMAYFLVSLFLGFYQFGVPEPGAIAFQFISNPLIGLAMGVFISLCFKYINDRVELDYIGLYPPLTISFLFLMYSLTTKLGGNGFLAVYIFGIFLGNSKIVHKKPLLVFFDGTSWLAQIGLFVLLGILVFPTRILEVSSIGILISVFLLLIARPAAVFLCLIKSNFSLKEKIFISWAGLKGATPIVFASFAATVPSGSTKTMFDIVFFTVLISALLQGGTLKLLAKKLGLVYESYFDPEFPIDEELLEKTKNGNKQFRIEEDYFAVGKRLIDLNLPKGALVLFILRDGNFIIPDGSTTFSPQDKVLLVTNNKDDVERSINCFKYDVRSVAEEADLLNKIF